VVFQNITQAVGLYDHYCEVQGHIPIDDDQWSQHLVQSLVWDAAGKEPPRHGTYVLLMAGARADYAWRTRKRYIHGFQPE
jgi:hypothetical protein